MTKPRISYIDPATITTRRCSPNSSVAPRGHAAAGKPGGPRPCAGGVLVVRQYLARRLQERRRRPQDQGAVPHLRVALGAVRILRQPALDQGGQGGPQGRRLLRPDQFRESRRATTSGRRRRSPMPRRSPGICRSTTHSGRACTSISASRELVEIGYFVAITMGQQRWLRTLNIEHHQILAGTDGSMAPGFETEDALSGPSRPPTIGPRSSRRNRQSQAAE